MRIRLLWPGKTHNTHLKGLVDFYLDRINRMEPCQVVETKTAKGLSERDARRIKEIEAEGLEKLLKDDYIVCLSDKGQQMSSEALARFLSRIADRTGQAVVFIVGGFLGLDEKLLGRADCLLSLSRMTYSHELSRVVLLEQIYRSLCIIKGRKYAK